MRFAAESERAGAGGVTRALSLQVRAAERRREFMNLALMLPSVVFVAVFFAWPIVLFLFRSVDNPEVARGLPYTCEVLESWDGTKLPPDAAFHAMRQDLTALKGKPELALLARRLNYNIIGFRSLLFRSARLVPFNAGVPATVLLKAADERWGDITYWGAIKNECGRITPFYLLSAIDLRLTPQGGIASVSSDSAVFQELFIRTFRISFTVAALCLLFGFPVAVVMVRSKPETANILLMLVLVPFWTSLLVRSTAWVILLQNQGLVNQALIWLGLLTQPVQLVFNRIGLYIAMVHILLPFMILPLYSVLKGIPPHYMQAAASLGGTPLQCFRRIYVPLAMPGIVAGSCLVFVLSLGYYVTPALVGGPGDQMIGYFIAYFTNSAVNWGMASALGTILLVIVFAIYVVVAGLAGTRAFRFS